MTMTTIKVDAALRDRLNARARERGVPVGSFVEEALEAWLREQRFDRLRSEVAATTREASAAAEAEDAAWDALAGDGLSAR
ncbi:ribbon-helix-helix protein, CopG family [Cellulosimicrobium arenosum]|uniref:ribbon-helix-helix protein, CopG family n=1 Tax=Cellulosimicrobium arenosum TaxID=2708133 RepID=UPI0019D6AF19|nr:ribbon-helix-helix protein, CopG family [Cellulosimicrobium arenosum]